MAKKLTLKFKNQQFQTDAARGFVPWTTQPVDDGVYSRHGTCVRRLAGHL